MVKFFSIAAYGKKIFRFIFTIKNMSDNISPANVSPVNDSPALPDCPSGSKKVKKSNSGGRPKKPIWRFYE